MKILGFNITRSSSPTVKAFDSSADDWLRGKDPAARGTVLSNAYEQVVWVYRAINVLAEQIGNIPFLFSRGERGRENLVTSGPLIDFYDRPHPQINRFQYWELRLIWLLLRGECFRIPIYSEQSRITHHESRKLQRVIIADPARFHHIVEDHELIGWRYTGFGPHAPLASQVFLPEEVWFEKLPNPFDFWRGLAPLQVAGLAAQTDFAAGSFMKGVMENNGDLGLVVRMQEQAGPEQREQLMAALRQRKRRAGSADEPLLLWNTAEIVQPQLSSSDLQFLENRKFSRSEICAAFGVPEEIVTTTDNSKYDVVQGARLNFIEHRVAPLCRRLEAGEDVTVKSLDPSAVGWFDLDSLPIMQKAQRDRLETARSVFDMGVPFNELNRVLDLGFRKLPWGDRGYIAARLVEVGEEGRQQRSENREQRSEDGGQRSEEEKEHAGPETGVPGAAERMEKFLQTLPTGEPKPECRSFKIKVEDGSVNANADFRSAGLRPGAGMLGLRRGADVIHPEHAGSETGAPLIVSRVRRFFFEQRGRVLANVAKGRPAFLDVVAEAKEIEALNLPLSMHATHAAQVREWLHRKINDVCQMLNASLTDGMARANTPEQLAETVRSIYNQIA